MEETSAGEPLVRLHKIVKRFGPVLANDRIDLEIRQGEIHALLGENGAGKSTLVKILDGLLQPTDGAIIWQGDPVTLETPVAAAALGIGMVFQHFSLFEQMTVAENIAVSLPPDESLEDLNVRIAAVGKRYGLSLQPNRPVWTLSAGEKQRIEIVRALLREPKLLILDEPTSVLTPQEAETLFGTLRTLAEGGCALLYITHRLDEVSHLCSRATILRGGKVVATCDPREETVENLASLMVGNDVANLRTTAERKFGQIRFEMKDVSVRGEGSHGRALKNVSLKVRSKQILGIAGVAGNGQSELFAVMSGEWPVMKEASILIDGQSVGPLGIEERRGRGAAFVPEERLGHSAVPRMSLSDNVVLSRQRTRSVVKDSLISRSGARAVVNAVSTTFGVRRGRADPPASTLSGGNLQKFVVGREILRGPTLLIVNQPTWGVDAGAAAIIRQSLIDLALRGTGVIIISQDLDEIFAVSDMIAVIHDGTLSEPVETKDANREAIGILMTGGRGAMHAA
ncbi:MAG: ABC transporter ATP-binding protein [Hyphomicrobiales bacterium]